MWDCLSRNGTARIRPRLAGLQADLIGEDGNRRLGAYLFTVECARDEEETGKGLKDHRGVVASNKLGHVFKGEDGNFYAYANYRILWREEGWMEERIEANPGYKVDTKYHSVEHSIKGIIFKEDTCVGSSL
jgi:hypothetical protein